MMIAIDRLVEKIGEQQSPIVAGLDTRLEYLPESFAKPFTKGENWDGQKASEAIVAFNKDLMQALVGIVPAVKVQVAYYEMYGTHGMVAFERTLRLASEMGFLTIADVKRNDIGATAEAYAMAYLGDTPLQNTGMKAFPSDFVTVNPYLGTDGILPFVKTGGGMFVLVKTSNPSSGEFQDQLLSNGKTLYELVGQKVCEWGKDVVGKSGYSQVGAVVGATYPEQNTILRKQMPQTFFLVPGYGAQGATAQDLAGCFDANGQGAIVNASRSLLLAYQKANTMDFASAARDEALRMKADLQQAITQKRG